MGAYFSGASSEENVIGMGQHLVDIFVTISVYVCSYIEGRGADGVLHEVFPDTGQREQLGGDVFKSIILIIKGEAPMEEGDGVSIKAVVDIQFGEG